MNTILVTGSAGFIGANLVRRLFREMGGGTIVGVDGSTMLTINGFDELTINSTGLTINIEV
jgi:nucleoside-diphosphate-sugar epimerase